jgi:hypothetical protein
MYAVHTVEDEGLERCPAEGTYARLPRAVEAAWAFHPGRGRCGRCRSQLLQALYGSLTSPRSADGDDGFDYLTPVYALLSASRLGGLPRAGDAIVLLRDIGGAVRPGIKSARTCKEPIGCIYHIYSINVNLYFLQVYAQ